MLAAVGCGEYPVVVSAAEKIVKVVDSVKPDPELVQKYDAQYAKFVRLYPQVKSLYTPA